MPKQERAAVQCYCIRLRRAAGSMTKYYDDALSPSGLTVNQYSLLSHLGRMGMGSITDLAARVGLDRSTVVRNLRPLVALGHVKDESGPKSRNRAMRVTQSGQNALAVAKPLWEQAQSTIADTLGRDDLDELFGTLARLEALEGTG